MVPAGDKVPFLSFPDIVKNKCVTRAHLYNYSYLFIIKENGYVKI